MVKKKIPFYDNTYVGLITGLIFPIIVFCIYYLVKFSDVEFGKYLNSLHQYRLLFKIMSLCVLADLPVFYLFIQFKLYRSSRGMVMACFLYAFAVMIYRFIV